MAKSEEKLIDVEVLRDFWGEPNDDGSDNRQRAGTVLSVSAEHAIELIEQGMAKRVKKDA